MPLQCLLIFNLKNTLLFMFTQNWKMKNINLFYFIQLNLTWKLCIMSWTPKPREKNCWENRRDSNNSLRCKLTSYSFGDKKSRAKLQFLNHSHRWFVQADTGVTDPNSKKLHWETQLTEVWSASHKEGKLWLISCYNSPTYIYRWAQG